MPALDHDVTMTNRDMGELGDLPPSELRAHLHRMADWAADYREGIASRRIQPDRRPGETEAAAGELREQGDAMSEILDDLDTLILPGVVHWGHPAFLGYFGSTSNGPALLGEMAAATLNVSAMTWKASPAATELESVVLRWIRDLIGLDSGLTGVVYDTASIATLHALAAAREQACNAVRAAGIAGRPDVPPLRIYASDQAHSSVAKAAVMLGVGEDNCIRVRSDGQFRMAGSALREAIARDAARGSRAMAVVATIGTTSTASVDPVPEIAAICAELGIWLHIDAAYGGAMGALPEGRSAMAGVERADSIVVNPHKWLFVPLDFSALYVRRPEALLAVFALLPEYLAGDATAPVEGNGARSSVINYMDYGVQLGRRFRALKAWMTFRALGRDGIMARLREHRRFAALVAEWVSVTRDFTLAIPPTMGVVCFRFSPNASSADAVDALNVAIVERVNAAGDVFLTHTRLRGRVYMRMGFGNILTTEGDIIGAWRRVQDEAHRIIGHRPLGGAGESE
ncbi:MAG: pyridoxal-dependent decarboxylase [Gemmatimonadaceae bacterium]